MIKKDKEKRD